MEAKIGKRSGWVTGVVMAHFLCSALFLGTCLVLYLLISQTRQQHGAERAATIEGLKLAIGIIAPMALVILFGAWGLLKEKLWGWWLSFLTDLGFFALFLYSMIDDGLNDIDWDVFAFTASSLVLVVWMLVPGVRRHYWNPELKADAKLESVNVIGTKA